MRLRILAAVALASVLLASAFARADDKAAAREAYRSGVHHYDFGEYAEALADFKTAYQRYEDPSFLFNIAQCHRQLNQSEEAVRVYRS